MNEKARYNVGSKADIASSWSFLLSWLLSLSPRLSLLFDRTFFLAFLPSTTGSPDLRSEVPVFFSLHPFTSSIHNHAHISPLMSLDELADRCF